MPDEGRFTSVLPHSRPKEDGQGYACEKAFDVFFPASPNHDLTRFLAI